MDAVQLTQTRTCGPYRLRISLAYGDVHAFGVFGDINIIGFSMLGARKFK